jgi:hypothetical protein
MLPLAKHSTLSRKGTSSISWNDSTPSFGIKEYTSGPNFLDP